MLPEEARGSAARNRAFMHRAAAWPTKNGVDQILDIGTGIPTEPDLHQIVQTIRPARRGGPRPPGRLDVSRNRPILVRSMGRSVSVVGARRDR